MSVVRSIIRGVLYGFLVSQVSGALPVRAVALSRSQPAANHPESITHVDRIALSQALEAYNQGRTAEAKPVLEKLVRKYPSNFAVVETLGLMDAEAGDFSSALPLLKKACTIRPSSARAQANLGTAYAKLNRLNEAAGALRRSATLNPEDAQTQSALGQVLMMTGHPRQAAAAFAAAASLITPGPNLIYNWTVALLDANDAKSAAKVLARLPKSEESAQIESLWGEVEERNHHYLDALRHYQSAARMDPSEANLCALGQELIRHWNFATATRILKYGLSKYPDSAKIRLDLALSQYASSNYRAAASLLAGLLKSHPENRLYAELLGLNCLQMQSRNTSDCDVLAYAARTQPSNALAALYTAEIILNRPQAQQNVARARTLLHQAIRANPKLSQAWFQMGVLDQNNQNWQDSANMLKKALLLQPDDAKAHYRLSRDYAHLGDRQRALREIQLYQKYSRNNGKSSNTRMSEVTKFLVKSQR